MKVSAMSVGEYCNREVVVVEVDAEVREAARLMRQHHVGTLLVVEPGPHNPIPVGIVTDRDLVLEVLAQDVDPAEVSVADIMTRQPTTTRESDDLWDTLQRMQAHGIRRIPVIDAEGGVVGILTADDALELLAEGLGDLAALIRREQRAEAERRP
jgi:CBS domain-containing protein